MGSQTDDGIGEDSIVYEQAVGTTLTLKSQNPSGPMTPGTPVTIVVTETNSGTVPITDVSVEGSGLCSGGFIPANVATLAAGASQDFTCTFTAPAAAPFTWGALGHGTDPSGNAVPTTNESVTGDITVSGNPHTTLTLKSQTPPNPVSAGTPVTIVVTETNSGNVPLTNVYVEGGGLCSGGFTPSSIPSLAVGASQDFTCNFVAPANGSWSATGHGTDPSGAPVPIVDEYVSGSIGGDVGGIAIIPIGGSGSSSAPYAIIGGIIATLMALTLGGWYARKMWLGRPS
jgi:hypothetical protein